MSDVKFCELWPRQFRRDIATRRVNAQLSLDALQNTGSEYAQGHRMMIDIYEATLAVIDAATDVHSDALVNQRLGCINNPDRRGDHVCLVCEKLGEWVITIGGGVRPAYSEQASKGEKA
jgi:hypothetical protein